MSSEQFSKLSKSSKSTEYQTPKDLFDKLNHIFEFQLDAATTPDNPLGTEYFFTPDTNALRWEWNYNTYINPPYGKRDLKKGKEDSIDDWINKMHSESVRNPFNQYVMLVPAATDTRWFQDLIMTKYRENSVIYLIKGRLKFINPEYNKEKNGHVKGSLLWIKNSPRRKLYQLRESIQGILLHDWDNNGVKID